MSISNEKSIQNFRQALDKNHSWPCTYTFKFIVPCEKIDLVIRLFKKSDTIKTRESKNGRYMSVTAKSHVMSSQEVVEVYKAAAQIKDIVSL